MGWGAVRMVARSLEADPREVITAVIGGALVGGGPAMNINPLPES